MFDDNQQHSFETNILIDECSPIEIYYGTSVNSNDPNSSTWRIKKISKIENIWTFTYPDGMQSYMYVWSNRLNYTYK